MEWDIIYKGKWIESITTNTNNVEQAVAYAKARYLEKGPMKVRSVRPIGGKKVEGVVYE